MYASVVSPKEQEKHVHIKSCNKDRRRQTRGSKVFYENSNHFESALNTLKQVSAYNIYFFIAWVGITLSLSRQNEIDAKRTHKVCMKILI